MQGTSNCHAFITTLLVMLITLVGETEGELAMMGLRLVQGTHKGAFGL